MYNAYPVAGVDAGAGSTGVPDYCDRLREITVFQEQALYNTHQLVLTSFTPVARTTPLGSWKLGVGS
jgi:hypothetical protein